MEKASSQAKDTRIKSLEDLEIELGHDPKDIKAIEQIIKKKNDDIAALKKQLKIPQLQHLQTQEVLEIQTKHEELMELVLKLNDQLRKIKKGIGQLNPIKTSWSWHYLGKSLSSSYHGCSIHVGSLIGSHISNGHNTINFYNIYISNKCIRWISRKIG